MNTTIKNAISTLISHRNGIITYDIDQLNEAKDAVKNLKLEWYQDNDGGWCLIVGALYVDNGPGVSSYPEERTGME